ncbi:MAG: hypothetical protein ACYCOU_04890, partial [Sulfobacillus sp.]
YQQQQALLERQLQILARIQLGIRYSLARLPDPLRPEDLKMPSSPCRRASSLHHSSSSAFLSSSPRRREALHQQRSWSSRRCTHLVHMLDSRLRGNEELQLSPCA